MTGVRKSTRHAALNNNNNNNNNNNGYGLSKEDEGSIVVIKEPEGGGPAQQVASLRTSLIRYMCNNCDKKYMTSLGLKRHLKFCSAEPKQQEADISLRIPRTRQAAIENRNNGNIDNLKLSAAEPAEASLASEASVASEAADSPGASSDEDNPYEFDEDGNATDEDKYTDRGKLCECCGEDKATAHKVLWHDTKIFNSEEGPCKGGRNIDARKVATRLSPKATKPNLAIKNNAGEYKCTTCSKHYKREESLREHLRRFHARGRGSLPCPDCPVSCLDAAALEEHARTHAPTRAFACKVCSKSFTRKYHLDRHLLQTGCDGRKRASFSCQVCGNVFSRKDNLREHLRNHLGKSLTKKLYTCEHCGKEFKGRTMMTIHVRSHTGENPFKCNYCPKVFKSNAACVKHQRSHTGEKPYTCKQCNRSFSAKETLNRHTKTHLEDKPFVCYECGKSFIQTSQLRAHMFYHTGENGFKCSRCELTFNTQFRLSAHEKYDHEGVERIKCPIDGCDKSFKRKDYLSRHLKIHTDERPFVCGSCSTRFRTKSSLKVHERTHRREVARSCPTCPRAFIRADCLLRHMRARHPQQYSTVLREARKNKILMLKERLMRKSMNPQQSMTTKEDRSEVSDSQDDQLLRLIAQSNDDIEVEVVDIPLSEEYLATSIHELLTLLIDKESLDAFNWSHLSVDQVLAEVIEKCGHTPIAEDVADRSYRLRENAKLLLTVVIDDSATKRLVETQTVDEVILHALRLGKMN